MNALIMTQMTNSQLGFPQLHQGPNLLWSSIVRSIVGGHLLGPSTNILLLVIILLWGNYCVFPEYHKCVLPSLTWMVDPTN